MKQVMLKCTESSYGKLSLQNPNVKVGEQGHVHNYLITEVPDNIPDSMVMLLANQTCFTSNKYQAKFSEIGIGKIVR